MKCPNCGQEFEGPRCPNCGRPVQGSPNRVGAIVAAVFLVLPAGLFGACSALFAASSVGGGTGGDVESLVIFGAMALGGFAACVASAFLVRKLWKG